jgi:hypothetical protein
MIVSDLRTFFLRSMARHTMGVVKAYETPAFRIVQRERISKAMWLARSRFIRLISNFSQYPFSRW